MDSGRVLAVQIIPTLPVIGDKPIIDYKAQNGLYRRVERVLGKVPGSGQCVAYAQSLGFRIKGNAKVWPVNAELAGYRVDNVPQVGAIIVTAESSAGTSTGHVTGAIEKIENGYAYITEGNYVSRTITAGWIPLSKAVAFIHPKVL